MGFDIEYLYFLQQLRNALGGSLDEFFNAFTKLSVTIVPVLPFVIYWCVDKTLGWQFIGTHCTAEVANGVVKLTVCAYRPWIRSNMIEPAGDSKVAATGYSFPSGHSMCATSVYGNIAKWQYNKRRWLANLFIFLIVLTGFSRNFLGVHTPQDVVVGILETLIILFATDWYLKKTAGNEKLKDRLTFVGLAVVVLVIVYILNKPYPMDYVDGKLLVDPQVMMNDTFKACGMFTGMLIGSYLERHYVHYVIPKNDSRLPILAVAGFMIYYFWIELLGKATLVLAFGGHWGNMLMFVIALLFALVIWPMVIMKVTAESEQVPVIENIKQAKKEPVKA